MNRRPESTEPPIIPGWDDLAADQTPPADGSFTLAFEVGIEGTYSAIVAAWCDDAGQHLRVIKQAPGTWWLPEEIVRLDTLLKPASIAADDGGPTRRVADEIERTTDVELRRLSMAERAVADMGLLTAAGETGDLDHDGSPALSSAVRLAALKTTNGVQTISRDRSTGPVPSLIAASVALYAANTPTSTTPQIW